MKTVTILTNERLREHSHSLAILKGWGLEFEEVSTESLKDFRTARAIDVIIIGNYLGQGQNLAHDIDEAIQKGLAPKELRSRVVVVSNELDPEIEKSYEKFGFIFFGERADLHMWVRGVLSRTAPEKLR